MDHPTFEELGSIQALKENYVVEAKKAQGRNGHGAVPGSMWETYSAFANTKGGWILLGVEESAQGLRPIGVGKPEQLRKQIWDLLENRQKVSVNLLGEQDLRIVEALVNTLIHADYYHDLSIRVLKSPSRFVFRNPGRLRVTKGQALRGGISDCRNPNLQKMFQMIGAAEKAGSGVPKIIRAWNRQHWRQPNLEDDVEREFTELTLTTSSLLDDDAIEALRQHFEHRFDQLERNAKIILVTTFQEKTTTHERLMKVLGDIHSRDLTLELDRLVNRGFLKRLGSGRGSYYELTGEYRSSRQDAEPTLFDRAPDFQASDNSSHDSAGSFHDSESSFQDSAGSFHDSENNFHDSDEEPGSETERTSDWDELRKIAEPVAEMGRVPSERMEETLLRLCSDDYRTKQELAELVQRKPEYLQQGYLTPMVKAGKLQPRHPERMTHWHQAYIACSQSE